MVSGYESQSGEWESNSNMCIVTLSDNRHPRVLRWSKWSGLQSICDGVNVSFPKICWCQWDGGKRWGSSEVVRPWRLSPHRWCGEAPHSIWLTYLLNSTFSRTRCSSLIHPRGCNIKAPSWRQRVALIRQLTCWSLVPGLPRAQTSEQYIFVLYKSPSLKHMK